MRVFLICVMAVTSVPSMAAAQYCHIGKREVVMPAPLVSGDQYGSAMAVSGDWLFVGAPGDDQLQADAGAVYVFQIDGGAYAFRQKLLAVGGIGPARFGVALAAYFDVLLVGADFDREVTQTNPNAWGAAYVFRLSNDAWIQEHKLLAFGAGEARQYGHAVALHDDLAVAGARFLLNDGVTGQGAAYVHRFNGGAWINEQRLNADVPSFFDMFGTALAVTPDSILVGSSQNDDVAVNAGAVYVFEHDGQAWSQQAKLYALDAQAGDQFGSRLAADATRLVIGSPMSDSPSTNSGAAYVFHRQQAQWTAGEKLVASNGGPDDAFGSSIALVDDDLLIGAPSALVAIADANPPTTYVQAGTVYQFGHINGQWLERRRLILMQGNMFGYGPVQCWQMSQQPPQWPQSLANVRCGISTSISPLGYMAGSALVRRQCWGFTEPEDTGSVNLFPADISPGCDLDWMWDACDIPDCNGNDTPDACDLTSAGSADCNANSVPDECESGYRYRLNELQPLPAQVFYWSLSSTSSNADFIWLNQYRVKPGGQVLTHMALASSPLLPPETPITIMVYGDPTNDGNPTDAVLLTTAETTSVSFGDLNTRRMVYSPIRPIYLGEPGTFFFIGAVVQPMYTNDAMHPWAAPASIEGPLPYRHSWRAFAPPGQANIHNLANNASPIQQWINSPFIVHGVGSDCNGNGVWDACEIAAGELPDLNSNGIPDSCDVPDCFFADLAPTGGDGEVNVLDLLHVIINWGVCNPCYAICPGDTNDDCATNVTDLLAVITSWGPCQ
jgi:hypothetical protein